MVNNASGLSLPQCVDTCRNTTNCLVFVFAPDSGSCWTKSEVRQVNHRGGWIAGMYHEYDPPLRPTGPPTSTDCGNNVATTTTHVTSTTAPTTTASQSTTTAVSTTTTTPVDNGGHIPSGTRCNGNFASAAASKIVGGQEAVPHSWPWIVGLKGQRIYLFTTRFYL